MGQASAENSAALTKLYDRISKLPPGLKISSAIDMANQIIEESKTGSSATATPSVNTTIQDIVDKYPPGTDRTKALKDYEAKYLIKPDPEDFKRLTQNDIMSLAKELGVIV